MQWLKWQCVAGEEAQDEAAKAPRTIRRSRRGDGEWGGVSDSEGALACVELKLSLLHVGCSHIQT